MNFWSCRLPRVFYHGPAPPKSVKFLEGMNYSKITQILSIELFTLSWSSLKIEFHSNDICPPGHLIMHIFPYHALSFFVGMEVLTRPTCQAN